jgi:hypothetical protein
MPYVAWLALGAITLALLAAVILALAVVEFFQQLDEVQDRCTDEELAEDFA